MGIIDTEFRTEFRSAIERKKGQLEQIQKSKKESETKIKRLKKEIYFSEQAQIIIHKVAKETQDQLEFHISSLVSLALASVFSNPYEFSVEFVTRRNAIECDLSFLRKNQKRDPFGGGGGTVDVASFGLRTSLWSLQKNRPVLILDEPFRNVNDPSRKLHNKLAEMVKMISDRLGIQIIIVSLHPELAAIGDKVFNVGITDEISHVIERRENQ